MKKTLKISNSVNPNNFMMELSLIVNGCRQRNENVVEVMKKGDNPIDLENLMLFYDLKDFDDEELNEVNELFKLEIQKYNLVRIGERFK